MAHFAKIDQNNLVQEVIVVSNQIENPIDFIKNDLQMNGIWLQTSYNTINNKHVTGGKPLRGNYAGIGFSYMPDLDIFMPPKCHEIATLDAETAKWICEDPSHKELSNANN